MTKISDTEPSHERPRAETYFDNEGGMFFVNGDLLEYFDEFRHRWTVIAHRPMKLLTPYQESHRKRPQRGASLLRERQETPAPGWG